MSTLPEIPHGHGKSFKKGLADELLMDSHGTEELPNGHEKSYERGREYGRALKEEIARKVKP